MSFLDKVGDRYYLSDTKTMAGINFKEINGRRV